MVKALEAVTGRTLEWSKGEAGEEGGRGGGGTEEMHASGGG